MPLIIVLRTATLNNRQSQYCFALTSRQSGIEQSSIRAALGKVKNFVSQNPRRLGTRFARLFACGKTSLKSSAKSAFLLHVVKWRKLAEANIALL